MAEVAGLRVRIERMHTRDQPAMRVGFFGQSGPFGPIALRHLVSPNPAYEIVLVVEGRKTPVGGAEHRWHRPGPRPVPAGEHLREIATALGIPALETCDVNGRWPIARLMQAELDLIVCVGFDRLFRPELLATARLGGINAHPSRLPELRGPSPLFWLLRQGASKSSVTLHQLDAKEDHGVIYAQEDFALPPRATGEELFRAAGALAARMLVPVLQGAATGSLHGQPQDHDKATRAPRPRPEDVRVDPEQWGCEHLVSFACGAPYFRAPWMLLGDETFFMRCGIRAEPQRRLPAQYVLKGDELAVQARDGIAYLEIQV